MESKRTQASRSAATRAALVTAARPLFADKGYAAVGTDEVARAAGVTRGALYHQFAGKVSPGVKFKDAELIGVPTIVTVGRGLADGVVEVRDRASDERRDVPVAEAAAHVAAVVRG